MAARTRKTAPVAEVEEVEVEETTAEPTFKQQANAAIDDAAAQLGVESKDRYKVQRAFGFIAIQNAIEAGELDQLIADVVDGAGDLPAGFGLERSVAAPKPEKAKAAAKPAARKAAPAKAAAKPAARKRPTR
ncbi:hypothetical protein SEA_CAPTAINREX_39 [Microbacterium phage CaptainRex]|nr:hypothetical protein SEA_HASITHA_39 [Microbacterium phage Hasitha]UVK59196.1 hypothetical protein SEA_LIBRIE_39 [Microbacterium phage Librie]WIC89869.1 hypothetical protein SEA_CAPTAINREX_39 [Microbacterium phage CaptainRex]